MEELAVDLADFGARWNTEAYPVLNSLPRGSDETRWGGATNVPDPIANGLDGDSIFVDNSAATTVDDGLFWDSTNSRPMTVKETSQDIYDIIDSLDTSLTSQIVDITSGFTSDQWDRLGHYIRDGGATTGPAGSLHILATGNETEAGFIQAFIGKAAGSDTTVFTEDNYVTTGQSLEAAVDALDVEMALFDIRDTGQPGYVRIQDGDSTILADVLDAGEDNSANTLNGPIVYSRLSGFDGSAWDRVYMGSGTAAQSLSVAPASDARFQVSATAAANTLGNPLFAQISQDGTNAISATYPLPISATMAANATANRIFTHADIDQVSGAAISATNPLFAELTDGTAVISAGNPLDIEEASPLNEHIDDTPAAEVTGQTDGTFPYYIEMDTYTCLSLQFIDTPGYSGDQTYTVQASLDTTTPRSSIPEANWYDVGNAWYNSVTWTTDAFLTDDLRVAGQAQVVRVKVVRANDGAQSDGAWTIFAKKLYA
jgi:hypothetical protein